MKFFKNLAFPFYQSNHSRRLTFERDAGHVLKERKGHDHGTYGGVKNQKHPKRKYGKPGVNSRRADSIRNLFRFSSKIIQFFLFETFFLPNGFRRQGAGASSV